MKVSQSYKLLDFINNLLLTNKSFQSFKDVSVPGLYPKNAAPDKTAFNDQYRIILAKGALR
jgi:hypothetical protein